MSKTNLSTRIANALRALRGDPWPVTFIEGPKITYTTPAVETYAIEHAVDWELFDLQGPEVTEERVRSRIADRIGRELLESGAIAIKRRPDIPKGIIYYRGEVRVVMPGEEGVGNG